MENNNKNTSIAPITSNQLSRVGNSITITNKLLSEDIRSFKKILCYNNNFFIEIISRYYPLTRELIDKFSDVLLWEKLVSNKRIFKDSEFIEKYMDKWQTYDLMWSVPLMNPTFLNEDFIKNNKVFWYSITRNPDYYQFQLTKEFIQKYSEKNFGQSEWYYLSKNLSIPWSIDLILSFKNKWDWKCLSSNISLPWDIHFIETFKDKWDWYNLSMNKSLPWDKKLIELFKDKWNWTALSRNEMTLWDEELLTKYQDKWDWKWLSDNDSIAWSEHLIELFDDKWCLFGFSINIKESLEVYLERYYKVIDWEYYSYVYWELNNELKFSNELFEKFSNKWNFEYLSRNHSLNWNVELIDAHYDKWDWTNLSINEALPWSDNLIQNFIEKWDWKYLSENRKIPWSKELIQKFYKKWDWKSLSGNMSIELNKEIIESFKNKWDWTSIQYGFDLFSREEIILEYPDKWDWSHFSNAFSFRLDNYLVKLNSIGINEMEQLLVEYRKKLNDANRSHI